MPFPSVPTGWSGPQQNQIQAAPPQYILDAIGPYDQSKYRWDQNSMSLVANDGSGSYNYSHLADPSLGTNVITYPGLGPVDMVGGTSMGSADPYGFSGGQVTNFSGTPFTGFAGGGNTFISDDPNAINEYQHDARTRNLQGVAQIGALVAGGAALNGLGGAAGGGGSAGAGAYGGPATTYPLSSGGAITGSAIPGVTSGTTAAGATAAGIAPAVAGGGNALSNMPDWVGNYLMPGVNAALGVYGANQATDAMTDASNQAIAEQRRQYDTTRADLQPWMDAGRNALGKLQDPNAFTASPGYEWARSEGIRDIGNSFASRGGAASGNALKALSEWQTGLAQQDYNNFWNRQAGLAGVGQNATTNVANFGQNTSANVGNYLANQGASRASGVLGAVNSVQNGVFDALDNRGYQNYLYRRRAA